MNRLAVLGMPVGHSRSPAIHNAAFAALGMEGEWTYEAIEVTPKQFAARVEAMPSEGFVGANVTVPHKGAALAVAEHRSEVAREIGAANTLIFEAEETRADNTDAQGLMEALAAPAQGKRALLLGAGGAARAALWALLREGAEVGVWNRTQGRAAALCAELGGSLVRDLRAGDYDLIINATSVGMDGEDPFAVLPLTPDSFRENQVVVDLVYAGESRLLEAASAGGARTVDGLEVLVRQGAASFRIWTGVDPPLDVMRESARA
jgi:shikimate dehydrogenase